MLNFDFSKCMSDSVGDIHGVSHEELRLIQPEITAAHEQMKKWRSSKEAIFMDSPFEGGYVCEIEKEAKHVSHGFENLVVLGIGGSALGLRCLANACLPSYANQLDRKGRKNVPRLFVCDNIDPDTFCGLLELINLKETCFVVISKSGGTTETMAQFFVVLPILKTRFGRKWKDHIYVVTDPHSGPLRKFVSEEGVRSFDLPPKLGGRFSVLSSVGLFPAASLGIDIESVLDGALAMRRICEINDIQDNPVYRYAAMTYLLHMKKGKNISVLMPYADKLALFADWYAQLLGESLGKQGKGLTPVKALGSTDQHSQVQLYMDGPNDKLITILGVERFQKENIITNVLDGFDHLRGCDLGKILRTSQKATAQALSIAKRPNITITLPEVNEREMGELFMFFEVYTAMMGALYRINPFDQPGVELGKRLTKQILTGK